MQKDVFSKPNRLFYFFHGSRQILPFPEFLQEQTTHSPLRLFHKSYVRVSIYIVLCDTYLDLSTAKMVLEFPDDVIMYIPLFLLSFSGFSEAYYFNLWIRQQYLLSMLCNCHSSLTLSLPLSPFSLLFVFSGILIYPMSLPGHYHWEIHYSLLIFIF